MFWLRFIASLFLQPNHKPINYMEATLADMRLPRGRLMVMESGKEIEIPKRQF